jgi:hypothetical protein
MSFVIEDLYCLSCSSGRCKNHISVKDIVDEKTGLPFKVVCVCPNHRRVKEGDKI